MTIGSAPVAAVEAAPTACGATAPGLAAPVAPGEAASATSGQAAPAAMPSCHAPAPSASDSSASLSAPLGVLRRAALPVGALLAAFAWVVWLLPHSAPLHNNWLLAAGATIVVWWTGWPILLSGWYSLRFRSANMNTLISLGSLAAWSWSVGALFGGEEPAHFAMAATIIVFVRAGGWLEARTQARSNDALESLARLSSKAAFLEDGTEISVEELEIGMRFVVRPGERIATDGVVVEGSSHIDHSLITGEPLPVPVESGAFVIGTALNTSGRLVVEATRVGADTAHAHIMALLAEAQQSRAPIQRLADRASAVFSPVVVVLALATFLGWTLAGGGDGLAAGVAVLVVACPCALGLATPTAVVAGVGRAAREGIIVRSGEVWEAARKLDVMVVDKTGTLTSGKPVVQQVVVSDVAVSDIAGGGAGEDATQEETQENTIQIGVALAKSSLHPLAKAVAAVGDVGAVELQDITEIPGVGITATLADGRQAALGSAALFDTIPADLETATQKANQKPNTQETHIQETGTQETGTQKASTTFIGWSEAARPLAARGVFICADEIRPAAASSVAQLREMGISIVMATGDTAVGAKQVADTILPDRVIAEALPQDKLAEVRRLQSENNIVAMVGDGINDSAALAQANIGVAMAGGSDVAVAASDITVVGDDFSKVVTAVSLARRTYATIGANLVWAVVYNALALPAAALGVLPPVAAAAAMSLSSLCVVGNSLRLAHLKL